MFFNYIMNPAHAGQNPLIHASLGRFASLAGRAVLPGSKREILGEPAGNRSVKALKNGNGL
jgi:hypothetical protein